jgi:hypothetical protein
MSAEEPLLTNERGMAEGAVADSSKPGDYKMNKYFMYLGVAAIVVFVLWLFVYVVLGQTKFDACLAESKSLLLANSVDPTPDVPAVGMFAYSFLSTYDVNTHLILVFVMLLLASMVCQTSYMASGSKTPVYLAVAFGVLVVVHFLIMIAFSYIGQAPNYTGTDSTLGSIYYWFIFHAIVSVIYLVLAILIAVYSWKATSKSWMSRALLVLLLVVAVVYALVIIAKTATYPSIETWEALLTAYNDGTNNVGGVVPA